MALPWYGTQGGQSPGTPNSGALQVVHLQEPQLPKGDAVAAKLNATQQGLLFGGGIAPGPSSQSPTPSPSNSSNALMPYNPQLSSGAPAQYPPQPQGPASSAGLRYASASFKAGPTTPSPRAAFPHSLSAAYPGTPPMQQPVAVYHQQAFHYAAQLPHQQAQQAYLRPQPQQQQQQYR